MGMDPSHLGSQLSRQMLRYRDFEVIRRCSSRRGTVSHRVGGGHGSHMGVMPMLWLGERDVI